MYAATGAKREMGGHRFQMGGRAPLAPRWRRPWAHFYAFQTNGQIDHTCLGSPKLRWPIGWFSF